VLRCRCETQETGLLYTQAADGIIGLGRGPSSIIAQLAQQKAIDDVFSLCFGGVEGGGAMVLGAVGVLPGTVWVPMLPQTRSVATCVDAWVGDGRPQASSATLTIREKERQRKKKEKGGFVPRHRDLDESYFALLRRTQRRERERRWCSERSKCYVFVRHCLRSQFVTVQLCYSHCSSLKL
jgi:hypothetical protein